MENERSLCCAIGRAWGCRRRMEQGELSTMPVLAETDGLARARTARIQLGSNENWPERPLPSTRHEHLAAGATQTLLAHGRSSRCVTGTIQSAALLPPPAHSGRGVRSQPFVVFTSIKRSCPLGVKSVCHQRLLAIVCTVAKSNASLECLRLL